MAKVKFDVSGDIPETINAPVGTYRGKIKDAEARDSNAGNPMVVITWELTHHADGKKVSEDYWPVRTYLMVADERPYAKRTIKQFVTALGLKLKGEMDLNKLIGKTAQLKLKSDTDQDGEYQPRIGQIMPAASKSDEDEPEPETPEAEEPEDDEEGEELDLDALSRSELKKLIKDEELEITVKKSMTDDDIRALIAEAMGGDEDEEEDDDEEPEEDDEQGDEAESEGDDEEEDDGYDDMSVADLKAELKERELPTNGAKKVLIARLRKDDQEEPF
jgi:SAP domain/Protein of unknown function (DUF669)